MTEQAKIKTSPLRRALRLMTKVVLFLLGLLLLLFGLINLPPVQKFLTDKAENFLKKKLNTEVEIGFVGWSLPDEIYIKDVYLEHPSGDSLFQLGKLEVGLELFRLLQREVQVEYIGVEDLYGDIYVRSDTSNIAFITEAFMTTDSSVVEEAPSVESQGTPWEILLSDAGLSLQNIDLVYDDLPTGIKLDLKVGNLAGKVGETSLTNNIYQVQEITLRDADIDYQSYPVPPSEEPSVPLDYTIGVETIDFENVRYSMRMDSMDLALKIPSLESSDIAVRLLGEDLKAEVPALDLEGAGFRYDMLGTPDLQGFDPNHLNLKEVSVIAEDLVYDNLDVQVFVEKIAGTSDEKFHLEDLKGQVAFDRQGLRLEDFSLQTKGSALAQSQLSLRHNFLDSTADLASMGLDIDLPRSSLKIEDLLYFSPDLAAYFKNKREQLDFSAKLEGTLEDLQAEKLIFSGLSSSLKAQGRVQNLLKPEEMALDVEVSELTSRGAIIQSFLPDTILPQGVQLPEFFSLSSKLKGELNDTLGITLSAGTQRKGSEATRINLRGKVGNLMNENLFYDLSIYKFSSTDSDLYAYLPDGVLPENYQIPQTLDITGQLAGTLNAVSPNLRISATAPEGLARFRTEGDINNFSNPSLDFSLRQTELDTAFLYYILPDSLLPEQLRLPKIEKGEISVQGSLADLQADLDWTSSAGDISADFGIKDEFYTWNAAIENLNFLAVTQGALYDTLARTDLDNLDLILRGKGNNLDSLAIARGQTFIQIKEINSSKEGLQINAELRPNDVRADILFDDIAGKANLRVGTDLKNRYNAVGNFEKLDFADIPYVRFPILMSGALDADFRYDSLPDMAGKLSLQDFNFRYDKENYPLKTMLADVEFEGENKTIKLRSDWVNADVKGNFFFDEIATQVQNLIYTYVREDFASEDTFREESRLTADIVWTKTDFLTSGIVPGLEQIEPFRLKTDFSSASDRLEADLDFPLIVYSGNRIENLKGEAATAAEALTYLVKAENLRLSSARSMGELSLKGEVQNGLLQTNLTNIDTTGATNLSLSALLDYTEEAYRLRFAEELTLNNRPWKFSPENEIFYNSKDILIENWELGNGVQSIALESLSPEKLRARFADFRIQEVLALGGFERMASGSVNGTVTVFDPLSELKTDVDLQVKDSKLYKQAIGDARIDVNNLKSASAYEVDFALSGAGNDAKIKGFYDLANPVDALNFQVDIKSLGLEPFNPFAKEFIHNLHGTLIADAEITGNVSAPSLVGFVQTEQAGLTLNQLGAPLDFGNQKIVLDGNVILFEDFTLIDSTGNKGLINAYIITQDFVDYEYDLDITAENFLILDTKQEDNELYYGKMIVDATAKVRGDLFSPIIDATASPREGSDLTYVVPAAESVVDKGEGVVRFINSKEKKEPEEVNPSDTIRSAAAQALNLRVNLNLEINDNLEFTAVVDPVENNQFSGKGEGFLSFTMYPSGEMEMSGTFTMKEGTYDFVYSGLVKRKFDVVSGSSLTWTGDIYNPALNVQVQYKVKANAEALGIGQSLVQTFIVQLDITGTLEKTDISTNLLYPDVNGNTKNAQITSAVNSLQQNQNRMNEQAFGLILFNSFVSQSLVSDANILNAQGGFNEAISSQLNNLAARYIKFVELDFGLENYDSYDADGNARTQTNLNLTVRKRLFQDRLVISVDGQTDSQANGQSQQTQVYLNNLTVEYALTKKGTWRIKVYNSRDADDPLAPDVPKTGTALIISKDFEKFRLFGN